MQEKRSETLNIIHMLCKAEHILAYIGTFSWWYLPPRLSYINILHRSLTTPMGCSAPHLAFEWTLSNEDLLEPSGGFLNIDINCKRKNTNYFYNKKCKTFSNLFNLSAKNFDLHVNKIGSLETSSRSNASL